MNTPDTEWEKEKEEFNKMWNEGKFHWNENQNTEINPQRIWNVFIQPVLSSRDTYWKERVRKEIESMPSVFHADAIPDTIQPGDIIPGKQYICKDTLLDNLK